MDIQYKNINTEDKTYKKYMLYGYDIAQSIKALIKQDFTSYKALCIKNARLQFQECKTHANYIKNNFTDLIVIGMGGAILNPKTLFFLSCNQPNSISFKIHFIDNTDPFYLQNILSTLALKDTAVIAISNSGQTLETNSLVGAMVSEFRRSGITNFDRRFFFITNPKKGMMCNIANEISATIIGHTPGISGRFSGLTNVSTLIAEIAGINPQEYLDGAEEVLQLFANDEDEYVNSIISDAAILITQKPILINIGYLQQFSSFLEWYCQIIAESLGKNDKAITPLRGLGPNDQHSMMQLYLDGPCDKMYNLFYVKDLNNVATSYPLNTHHLNALASIAMADLATINSGMFLATKTALEEKKFPVRTTILADLSPKSIGKLVAHSMLEVIIAAHLMGVNPFDQPGVELIKTNAKKIIEN